MRVLFAGISTTVECTNAFQTSIIIRGSTSVLKESKYFINDNNKVREYKPENDKMAMLVHARITRALNWENCGGDRSLGETGLTKDNKIRQTHTSNFTQPLVYWKNPNMNTVQMIQIGKISWLNIEIR